MDKDKRSVQNEEKFQATSICANLLIRSGISSETDGTPGFEERDWISLASSLQEVIKKLKIQAQVS